MRNSNSINDDELNKVSGGRTLPEGWEKTADAIAPTYMRKYQGKVNYAEACEMVKGYLSDPEDQELVFEYMKKYFPDEFPEYQQ